MGGHIDCYMDCCMYLSILMTLMTLLLWHEVDNNLSFLLQLCSMHLPTQKQGGAHVT